MPISGITSHHVTHEKGGIDVITTIPLTYPKTLDEQVISSTTLQNDDELVFPVEANSRYAFMMMLKATIEYPKHMKFAFALPSGASAKGYIIYSNIQEDIADLTISYMVSITSSGIKIVQVRGLIITGATAGNAQLQWAQGISSATATIVHAGSYIAPLEV
jgi:hypothetical protein